ncbi:hypothetical protein B9Z55_007228 [Caenorhabditis nigoni]|uniref:Peptidase A2 domain-containing protein n=1 Tax=Caenorhabditis nigoni TaxID=1611254 RepID=A0A2G5V8R6_9PELO|nr:hypothetical protein B9Z55_007228 [Caenorhabditis nigoni]
MSVSDDEKVAEKMSRDLKQQSDWTKVLDRRVTKFSDGKSYDLKEWLDNFSRTLHRCHIPPEKAIGIIPFYLSGPALLKYNRLDESKMVDWETAGKMLIEAHDCPAEKEVALQELTTTTQGKKNLSDFGQHIRTLGNYAYDSLTKENKEHLMASHFLAGVSKKIRSRLRTLQKIPKTLTEMQAEAEKIQRLLQIEEEEDEEDKLIAQINQLNLQNNQNQRSSGNGRGGRNFRGGNRRNRGNGRGNFQNNWYGNQPNQGNQGHTQNSWDGNPVNYDDQNSSQNNWNDNFHDRGNQGYSGNGQTQNQGNQELKFDSTTGRPYVVNSVSRFLLGVATIVAVMTILPSAGAKPQICGFGEAGNIFIPPRALPCSFTQNIPLKAHKVNVFSLRNEATTMEAIKCFKHQILGETFSFLNVYKKTEAKIGRRSSVSQDECRRASISKKFREMELKEVSPGIFRSDAIPDVAANQTRFWGTNQFTTFEFTMEIGQIATIDGHHAVSSLGDLEACNFGTGVCQDESTTIVWQPVENRKECQYRFLQTSQAIISQNEIAIEEMGIFSNFDNDLRRLQNAAEGCFVHQPYLTDDGYLIEFYEAPLTGWVPDMHIDADPSRRNPRTWNRGRREIGETRGPGELVFQFDLGENFTTPIWRKLFGVNKLSEVPEITNPISEPVLLREISRYNVTPLMLTNRARFYPQERKSPNSLLLITLKAIRIAQYGARQLEALNQIKTQLTKGEITLKNWIERKDVNVFNKLLDREFGRSLPDFVNPDNTFVPPSFLPESLKPYEGLQPEHEAIWIRPNPPTERATSTAPPLTIRLTTPSTPAPYSTRRSPVTPTPTTKPATTLPTTTPRRQTLPPVTTESPREKDREHIPSENINIVQELETPSQYVEQSQPQELPQRSEYEIFRDTCQEQWKTTSLFETILQIDPTAAIRQLLKRSDVSAKRIGDTLLISSCRTVVPDIIHWDRKVNSTCYDLIPVTVKDKVWFFLPGTEDLIADAVEIPCEERPPSVRWEHNRYVGVKNQEILPQHLSRPSRGGQQHFILKSPETFYTIISDENGVSTGVDREKQVQMEQNSRRLKKRLITEGILKNTLEKLADTGASAGRSARSIYDSAMEKLRSGFKMVVFELLILVLYIALPIGIIAIIVCGVYAYIKYKAFKATGKAARNTAKAASDAVLALARRQLRINNVDMLQEAAATRPLRSYRDEYTTFSVYAVQITGINAVSAARLPHIDVELDGERIEALFDSGATVSYLPLTSVKTKIENKMTPSARTANGSIINFIGTCSATLKIGDISVTHTWVVSTDQECPAQMLIGSDLIMKLNQLGHGITINLHEKELKIGDNLIRINPNPQSFFLNTARGPSFVEGKGCCGLETREQEDQMVPLRLTA